MDKKLEELERNVNRTYGNYMYYECAEIGYDHEAASIAHDEYLKALDELEQYKKTLPSSEGEPEQDKSMSTKKIRDIIYDYVYENFGESEANNPSWYIPLLAEEIADKLDDKNYTPLHTYHNDEDEEDINN